MLQQIWIAATDLPVVIQGALGSGLFALALWLGQRIYAFSAEKVATSSKVRRRKFVTDEIAKLQILTADNYEKRSAFLGLLIYRSLKSLFKALIWLVLGLLFSSVEPVLGIVGYLGALYYFFGGLNTVRSPAEVKDKEQALSSLTAELKKIDGHVGARPQASKRHQQKA